MADYTWNVFTPGADLPQQLETEYLLAEGEEIELGGRQWLVERVAIAEDHHGKMMRADVVAVDRPSSPTA